VALTYHPDSNDLEAITTITGTATAARELGRFNLDLQPDLTVSAVTVNGAAATFAQQGSELVITPAAPVAQNGGMTVRVSYSGQPGMIDSGASNLGAGGWYRTQDGGALAAGEPFSASAWYPVNEHPSDPAAFSVTATVPDGWQVISNGTKVEHGLPRAPDGMHVVRFDQERPIASYLTTILIDRLTFTTGTVDGTPILNAFTTAGAVKKALAGKTAQVLTVLGRHFGPFPFDSYGGIYTGEYLSFALETATRPVYASWVDLDTMVHETAHQWYGDDVIIDRWSDVCLNECFASYAPWLYHQDVDGANLDARWRSQMAKVSDNPSFWAIPLVDMGPGNEFTSVYNRGPLALHALRHEMGEKAFARLLKGWIATYGGHNASFDDLEDYASTLAGKDLRPFMDAWFRGTVVPPEPYRTPPGLG
jgi:aminopeptidase N